MLYFLLRDLSWLLARYPALRVVTLVAQVGSLLAGTYELYQKHKSKNSLGKKDKNVSFDYSNWA